MKRIMSRATLLARLSTGRLRRLAGDERGVSAVEFALLLPLMLTLYFGAVEISQGIAADRKVTLTARSIGDLVSRATSITNADMTNSLNAASAVMSPYPVTNLKLTVSSVSINAEGVATIKWSDALNGTARVPGEVVTLPPGDALKIPNTSLIWTEAQYSYKPVIGYVLSGTLTLKDQIYMRPRLSLCITRPPAVANCP
jgi:Flp pilus assembly protein TadG